MSTPRDRQGAQPALDPRRHFVLAILCAVAIINMVDRQIITIVLDPIKHEFGASDTAMGLLTGMIFAGFYAAASFPLARWADKGDRHLVMAACLGFWSLMTTLGGLAQSFVQLAVTRVGVAVGEAGAQPTSHSMLSDLYPVRSRATVLAMYSACGSAGIGLGVLLGGWLSDTFDWRTAFFIVGAPGLVLAIAVYFLLPEPQRGAADGLVDDEVSPTFMEVLVRLGSIPTYRYLVLIAMFVAICGYGTLMWGPTFLRRVHHLTGTEAGLGFGLATMTGLVLGNLSAGVVADWAGRHDVRWYMLVAGIGPAIGFPCGLLFVFASTPTMSLIGYVLFACFITFHIPPVYAMVQTLAPLRMRAMAAVFIGLSQTIVGIGLTPLLIGAANDYLEPQMGLDAVRYSLAFVVGSALLASVVAIRATFTIRADYQVSQQRSPANANANEAVQPT
jgi:MFS family permease